MEVLCSRLRALRGSRTQAEISRILGIKQQVWARYEQGLTTPGSDVLHQICSKLNASSDWLLGLSEELKDDTRAVKAEQKLEALKKAITELLKEY